MEGVKPETLTAIEPLVRQLATVWELSPAHEQQTGMSPYQVCAITIESHYFRLTNPGPRPHLRRVK